MAALWPNIKMLKEDDIIEAIERSNLMLTNEVVSKIKAGWKIDGEFVENPTECKQIFKTYSIRNKGLAQRTSLHAIQLHESTEEFLNNLSENIDKSCYVNDLSGAEDHDYFFAFEPENKEILGIMKVYSQLKVSPERWREIWAKP